MWNLYLHTRGLFNYRFSEHQCDHKPGHFICVGDRWYGRYATVESASKAFYMEIDEPYLRALVEEVRAHGPIEILTLKGV